MTVVCAVVALLPHTSLSAPPRTPRKNPLPARLFRRDPAQHGGLLCAWPICRLRPRRVLMQLSVPIAIIVSWFVGRDKPSIKNSLGALLCLIGVVRRRRQAGSDLGLSGHRSPCWSASPPGRPRRRSSRWLPRITVHALYAALARYATPQMLVVMLVMEHGTLLHRLPPSLCSAGPASSVLPPSVSRSPIRSGTGC